MPRLLTSITGEEKKDLFLAWQIEKVPHLIKQFLFPQTNKARARNWCILL
jgi:hypothetical protein